MKKNQLDAFKKDFGFCAALSKGISQRIPEKHALLLIPVFPNVSCNHTVNTTPVVELPGLFQSMFGLGLQV